MGSDICAVVVVDAGVQPQDRAVGCERDANAVLLLAGVIEGHQVLAAILDPCHGLRQSQRQVGDEIVFGVEFTPPAEAATHLGLDHANAALGELQEARQDRAVEMGHLRRAPHGQPTAPHIVVRGQPAALQGDGGMPVG